MGLCINPNCEKAKKEEDQGLSLFCTSCGSSLLINDLYRVIKYLGGGGFGVTYLVDDCGTPKVLKILHNTDPKAIALFDQESSVLANLNHPGIPTVEAGGRFDYVSRGSQEPLRCLVMEYIEGENLEDYLAKRNYQPISEQAAIRWLKQLIEILAQVHSANYFHRDIKPANVMLRSSGQIALIDFGTAREETQTYLQKVQGKGVTGIVSVGYTPHEQAHGKAEYRSDFFAVGRTFVFLLTGKTPNQFQESLKKGLVWQQDAQGYHQELRDLIDELMNPDVSERPINAQAVLTKLESLEVIHNTKIQSHISQSTLKQTWLSTLPKWSNRRNVLIGLGAAGVTGLTVIAQQRFGISSKNVTNFTETLPGGIPLEMIGIPAGEFMIGASDSDPNAKPNEKPPYLVKVKSFAIGKYPITRRQWLAVTGLNLQKGLPYFDDFPEHPVEWVDFVLAQEFCQKLSQLTRKIYELPNEAQWEYAYRAGTKTRFYWGNDVEKIGNYAWILDNSSETSHKVGQRISNTWGLYDMAGNVWEWCSNNWRDDYRSEANSLDIAGQFRAIRGGCWGCNALDARSSSRQKTDKDYSSKTIGFRVIYQASS